MEVRIVGLTSLDNIAVLCGEYYRKETLEKFGVIVGVSGRSIMLNGPDQGILKVIEEIEAWRRILLSKTFYLNIVKRFT